MKKFSTESDRLEAFSDGVIAVIITIMVLELRPPHADTLHSFMVDAVPSIVVYAVSFVFVGTYWNNHHHMLRASKGIDGAVMWANLNLLFWLSLVPVSTAWLAAYPTAAGPTALYSVIFLLDGIAYAVLQQTLVRVNGKNTPFTRAVAVDRKGWLSLGLYVTAVAAAFLSTIVSDLIIVAVEVIWLIPDRRFEPLIDQSE